MGIATPGTRSGTLLLLFVFGALGSIFLLGGLLVLAYGFSRGDTMQQLAAYQPLTATNFRGIPSGQVVYAEGRVGASNPLQFEQLVAYQRWRTDSRGNPDEQERVLPPLLLEVADGVVPLAAGYTLPDAPVVLTRGEDRYTGLVVGDAVLALGTVERTAEGVVFQAQRVTLETFAEYRAQAQRNAQASTVAIQTLGKVFSVAGAASVGICGIIIGFVRARRR